MLIKSMHDLKSLNGGAKNAVWEPRWMFWREHPAHGMKKKPVKPPKKC